jgi:hypothetical protein
MPRTYATGLLIAMAALSILLSVAFALVQAAT